MSLFLLINIFYSEEENINSIIEDIELVTKSTNDEIVDRSTSIRLNKLHRELQRLQNLQKSLPDIRENAIQILKESLDEYSGSASAIKAYRHAIKIAKQAKLMGTYDSDEDFDGIWVLDTFRDVVIENRAAEKRKRIMDLQKDLVAKRDKCFVRTDCLGKDKDRNTYWSLSNITSANYDTLRCAVWIEKEDNVSGKNDDGINFKIKTIGSCDFEADFSPPENESNKKRNKQDFVSFSRKEYHHSGTVKALPKMRWGCFTNEQSLRRVIRRLDDRGLRESHLKESLKEITEKAANTQAGDSENRVIHSNGDHEHFKLVIESSNPEDVGFSLISSFTSAIGKRVRIKQFENESYEMGTVTGWFIDHGADNIPKEDMDEESLISEKVQETNTLEKREPFWRVTLDCDDQEIDLDCDSLRHGLLTACSWSNQVRKLFCLLGLINHVVHYIIDIYYIVARLYRRRCFHFQLLQRSW